VLPEVLIAGIVHGYALERELAPERLGNLLLMEGYVLGHVEYVEYALALELVKIPSIDLISCF
jgi:hypothetical protein